jgi:high-affinity nickel permease
MATLLTITILGFFLGMRHATDPDHVVAVTTIVSRERSLIHASIIGALWGLGHTLTILLVGSGMILFKLTIPPRIGLGMELSVGCMLILLGLLNLTGVMQWMIQWATIRGVGGAHSHLVMGRWMAHTHQNEMESDATAGRDALADPRWWKRLSPFHLLRPLVVGIVHGLAGSAAIALLVLATIHRPAWAIAYLLIFGIGTIAGMMLITATIAIPFAFTMRRFARLNQGMALASGVISVCFGLFLCYQIGFVDGLFTSHPNWVPK